jgi:hypothetical protein
MEPSAQLRSDVITTLKQDPAFWKLKRAIEELVLRAAVEEEPGTEPANDGEELHNVVLSPI